MSDKGRSPDLSSNYDPIDAIGRAIDAVDARNPVILLDGAPLSGVTRSMYEAVQGREFRLIQANVVELPRIADELEALEDSRNGDHYLVWLDDLSPADLVLLGPDVLESIVPHAMLLASINSALLDRIMNDRSLITGPARAAVLEYATRISVPFEMSRREWATISANYPYLKPGPSIAATFVGGEALVKRYLAARRQHPDGQLLVQAAVDARRCGIHRGLSETELHHLFVARVADNGTDPDERFVRALEWASVTPPDAGLGLLYPAAGDVEQWKVLSYIAAADDGFRRHRARDIPDIAWSAALAALSPIDAYAIGVSAFLLGRHAVATAAFQQAAAYQDQEPAISTAATAALDHIG